ncbi:MAG: hypothetical protein IKS53_06305 [Bacteroidales bacterium]|nr:hypothetical protein [Bacteroidales bacterium]
MKKVMFLLATLLIGGMMFTGCKKDTPSTPPTPDTPSTPTTRKVVYKLDNTVYIVMVGYQISPCFHYNFSYKDTNGTMVEVNDPTLPWTKEISVKAPFEAKIEGKVTYNEAELPETVYYGRPALINNDGITTGFTGSKEKFIEYITARPDKLEFSNSMTIE